MMNNKTRAWIDRKKELPIAGRMVWVACPNAYTCTHQTLLWYIDSDGQWRDAGGVAVHRKVSFWQYADVPQCDVPC